MAADSPPGTMTSVGSESSPVGSARGPSTLGTTGRIGRGPARFGQSMDMPSAQGRLQEEYAAIQRRAQELMDSMQLPDEAVESPPADPVAAKLAAYPHSANGAAQFTIGAGIAAPDGEVASAIPARVYRATAFDQMDPESPTTAKGAGVMYDTDEREPKKYHRAREINWLGMAAYIFFILAFGFYMWIRITKTLDLGIYLGYGIFVLAVEILGATTVALYGVNLLFNPVIEKFEEDPNMPGRPKVVLPYHVRVLVPCYKEDLAIVRRTIMAAYDALLPADCARTIYLCDDGKDPKKRAFCRAIGPEVVYVSGRKRPEGEMNGKSGNINNCCSQIYPKGTKIPPNELICIFDADQVCSNSFYLKTLPLFDGGDDVGMVLSPQCFHNLNLHADIFNHSNVHFWEYMQPGYDALGFISCTGTNFMVRAGALREVGGSPTYTLTEDFALGMALKMYGWHCRYVQEYLAIGEAPDQIRNCYQQRSRWCKGHFQIMFNRRHCPLLQPRLSFGMKILYASGVWSYIVGSISTPTFILIPMITVWFGIFPIIINWWAALGVTVYGVSTQLVLYYVRSPQHMEALWFANVSNSILWFTYVKACWRAVGSVVMKKGITFKTTMKGAGMLAAGNLRDLWMPLLCFTLLFVTFIYGLVDLFSGAELRSPLIISIIWAFYNMLSPMLVVWYGWVSTGTTLQLLCRICLPLSFIAMSLATLFMWFLYPNKFNYTKILTDTPFFYEANMLGNLPAGYNVPWRGDAFTNDTSFDGADLTGGWITGGTAGIVKMTIPHAFTTTLLAWSLLSFPKAYIEANSVQRSLDQLSWGTDYLRKTFVVTNTTTVTNGTASVNGTTDTNSTSTVTTVLDGNITYQVGNYTLLKDYWGFVEDLKGKNPTYSVNISNGASDLGGQIVAALAASSMVFRQSNPDCADALLNDATQLYAAVSDPNNQGIYSNIKQPDCRTINDPIVSVGGVRLPLCGSLGKVLPADGGGIGGSAIDQYMSGSYLDDLSWAASWLYRASKDNDVSYLVDAQAFYVQHVDKEPGADLLLYNWDNMYWAINVFLAQTVDDGAAHERTRYFLKQWICGANPKIKFTPKGMAYNTNTGNYLATQTAAYLATVYGTLVQQQQRRSRRYLCWARAQSRYALGDNKGSLVVGYGKSAPRHAANMPASCPARPRSCSVFSGYLTPDPNPHVLTGALVQAHYGSDIFNDVRNLNDTIVAIDLQAAFTGVIAGLAKAPGRWEQCLQGYGPFSRDAPVCTGD